MSAIKSGVFGLVIGVGGAFAVTAWYDDNPVFAVIVAAITIAAALATWWLVDRPANARRRDEL